MERKQRQCFLKTLTQWGAEATLLSTTLWEENTTAVLLCSTYERAIPGSTRHSRWKTQSHAEWQSDTDLSMMAEDSLLELSKCHLNPERGVYCRFTPLLQYVWLDVRESAAYIVLALLIWGDRLLQEKGRNFIWFALHFVFLWRFWPSPILLRPVLLLLHPWVSSVSSCKPHNCQGEIVERGGRGGLGEPKQQQQTLQLPNNLNSCDAANQLLRQQQQNNPMQIKDHNKASPQPASF